MEDSKTDSRRQMIQFLVKHGFMFPDERIARLFAEKLKSNQFLYQTTFDSLPIQSRDEFEKLNSDKEDFYLDIFQNVKSESAESKSVESESHDETLLDFLRELKIPLPKDIDDFLLRFVTLSDFRKNVCGKLTKDQFQRCESLCKKFIDEMS